MAELDLLAPEGYVEEELGPLTLRTARLEPPDHPLGTDYTEPHFGIFGSASNWTPRGWVCLFATPRDPEEAIATLDEESQERTRRLSILLGVPWQMIVHRGAKTVSDEQEAAVKRLPPNVYQETPEALRSLRTVCFTDEPLIVATLVGMAYHWQTDLGGYCGPRHP